MKFELQLFYPFREPPSWETKEIFLGDKSKAEMRAIELFKGDLEAKDWVALPVKENS